MAGGTWVDRLTPLGAFAVALVGHVTFALVSHSYLITADGTVILWLASGITVGLMLAANRSAARLGALSGGLVGHAIFLAAVETSSSSIALMTAHIIEVCLAGGAILLLFLTRPSESPGPSKSILAMLACLSAAMVASVPVTWSSDMLESSLLFGASHGIGTFAVTSVVLLGRAGWLVSVNPTTHRREFVATLATIAAIATATVFVEQGLLFVGLGACLLFTSRFGTRAGQPVALLYSVLAGVVAARGFGTFPVADSTGLGEVHAFSAAIAVLTAMVGRMTFHADLRVRAEQAESERWQKLASTGFDGFIEIDAHSNVVDTSDSVALLLGMHVDDIRGLPFRALFNAAGWSKVAHFVRMVMAGQSVRFDRSFETATGETRWALALTEPRMDDDGNFAGCTVFLLDTTTTHKLNAERARSRAALLHAQEAERLRLAQLVHDGALQDLAAANLLIGASRLVADGQPNSTLEADHLKRIEELLVSGMRKLRADAIGSAIIDLRETNVVDALEQTVEKFASINAAEVHVRERGIMHASAELSEIIFQIAREALVNAMVHSEATIVNVDLRQTRDGFSIAVIDDGVGFDKSRLQEVGHLGLSTMTALAYQAGGWCSLSTRPGRGTSIEAWIPSTVLTNDAVLMRPSNHLGRDATRSSLQDLLS